MLYLTDLFQTWMNEDKLEIKICSHAVTYIYNPFHRDHNLWEDKTPPHLSESILQWQKIALNQTETPCCFLKPAFSTKLSFEGDLGNLRTVKKKEIVGKN